MMLTVLASAKAARVRWARTNVIQEGWMLEPRRPRVFASSIMVIARPLVSFLGS